MSLAALNTYLEPLRDVLNIEGISEVSINQPGEVWIDQRGKRIRFIKPEVDLKYLKFLARLVAQSTAQDISEQKPLLSATLPEGYRIQIIYPPACEADKVIVSIRKQTIVNLDLDDYEKLGAFDNTLIKAKEDEDKKILETLLEEGKIKDFIKQAVKRRKNIIVSGGTSTGKTTFMNATLRAIPDEERIITVEDAREIQLVQPNKVHLVVSRGGQGIAQVTTQTLIESCLRLAPDRIIVGELRGAEAFSFVRAINTGHPGSIATLHADSPKMAIEQLVLMLIQADIGLTRGEIIPYLKNVIDIIVQLKRGENGNRYVSEIYYNKEKGSF
jgi:type IV secretion system protein VirB11